MSSDLDDIRATLAGLQDQLQQRNQEVVNLWAQLAAHTTPASTSVAPPQSAQIPEPPVGEARQKLPHPERFSGNCYRCGKLGHVARHCLAEKPLELALTKVKKGKVKEDSDSEGSRGNPSSSDDEDGSGKEELL